MICPKCETESGASLFCYVCDTYLPSVSAGVKASIPARLGAYLLDVLVLLTLMFAIGAVAVAAGVNVSLFYRAHGLEAFLLVILIAGLTYFLIFLWLLARGQTPGKWLMDIRAVDKRDGSQPGLGRMLLRETLGKLVSGFFLALGWFWVIWDRDAQAWHDKIAGTVVLYRRTDSRKLLALGLLFGAAALCVGFAYANFTRVFIQQTEREDIAANEADVVGSLRTIDTATGAFRDTYGIGFPSSLRDMGTNVGGSQSTSCTNAELIDNALTSGTKSGYKFTFVHGNTQVPTSLVPMGCTAGYSDGYVVTAVPTVPGVTGQRSFCTDATGVIRYNTTSTADYTGISCDAAQSPIGQGNDSQSTLQETVPEGTGLQFTRTPVLGFRFGESAHDMGERAGTLGFHLTACGQRSADTPDYVDCKLLRDNGDSLTISFLNGKLQRLELWFRIENYDQVLQAIERDHGSPRIIDSGSLQGTAEWGSVAEGVNISLGKTADMTQGWLDATEMTISR